MIGRIREKIHQQNWLGVFIDFIVVVLGVYIGIQASNYNNKRSEMLLARKYIERLRGDLNKDLADTQRLASYYLSVVESVERFDSLLSSPESDNETLILAAYRASEINYFPATRATWDEIVSSGHLGLLPKAALEVGMSEYFAFDTPLLHYEYLKSSRYRALIREIIPLNLQLAIRGACGDNRNEDYEVIGFVNECILDAEIALIEDTATALRENSEIRSSIRFQYSGVSSAFNNVSSNVIFLERALAALST